MNNKKYITLDESTDFRTIAKIMSDNGFQMNHATARNQLILAMEDLLSRTTKNLGINLSSKEIQALATNKDVHELMQDILYNAYLELKKDNNGIT